MDDGDLACVFDLVAEKTKLLGVEDGTQQGKQQEEDAVGQQSKEGGHDSLHLELAFGCSACGRSHRDGAIVGGSSRRGLIAEINPPTFGGKGPGQGLPVFQISGSLDVMHGIG